MELKIPLAMVVQSVFLILRCDLLHVGNINPASYAYRGVQLIRGNLTSKITLNGENHGLFCIVIQSKKDLCLNS